MIHNNVLNHMDADELRNYIYQLSELNEQYHRYIIALTGAIEKYNDLLNINNNVYQCDSDAASKRKRIHELEEEIYKRYEDYIPTLMNGCTTLEGKANG